jgi:hypothetical protein
MRKFLQRAVFWAPPVSGQPQSIGGQRLERGLGGSTPTWGVPSTLTFACSRPLCSSFECTYCIDYAYDFEVVEKIITAIARNDQVQAIGAAQTQAKALFIPLFTWNGFTLLTSPLLLASHNAETTGSCLAKSVAASQTKQITALQKHVSLSLRRCSFLYPFNCACPFFPGCVSLGPCTSCLLVSFPTRTLFSTTFMPLLP